MRCRLRKTKCDGGKPCTRCTEADDVCEYMKCSKKESKEYSQDYVQRLLEQNDKYKIAMRVLYANRRLSIQPDSIVIPSTDSDDVPLVHDILDRLGLLGHSNEDHSTASAISIPKAPKQTPQKDWSTSSMQSSLFDTSMFDSPSTATLESPTLYDMPALPDFESEMLALDTDMGLNFPYQVYETMNASATDMFSQFTPKHSAPQHIGQQDWCPLSALDNMMNSPFPMEETWGVEKTNLQYSY